MRAHDEQPQYYYECKKDLVVFGRCPYLHVFDKSSNKCRYQRYVDLDVDIIPSKCTKEGKFPVRTNCSLYYICNKNGKEFKTQVFRCPGSSVYSPDIRRCSIAGACSPSTIVYDDSIKCPEVYELSFPGCSEEGMYRTRSDCSLYYNCSHNNEFGFIETRYKCDEGKAFSIEQMTCLPKKDVKCEGERMNDYDFGDESYSDLNDYENEETDCDKDNDFVDDDNMMVGSKLTTTEKAETTTEEGSGESTLTPEETTLKFPSTELSTTELSTSEVTLTSSFETTTPEEETTISPTTISSYESSTSEILETTLEIENTTVDVTTNISIETTPFNNATQEIQTTVSELTTDGHTTNIPETTIPEETITDEMITTVSGKTDSSTSVSILTTETTSKPTGPCLQVISHCIGYNGSSDPDKNRDPDVSLVPEKQTPVGTVVVNVPQHPVDIIFRFRPDNKGEALFLYYLYLIIELLQTKEFP